MRKLVDTIIGLCFRDYCLNLLSFNRLIYSIVIKNNNKMYNIIYNIIYNIMLNIAIFVSGRLLGYKDCLLPFVNNLKERYNIYLFFSINTFSLSSDTNIDYTIQDLKQTFGSMIGDIYFEEYKLPKCYVDCMVTNNIFRFSYNSLSHFFNDSKNMELIELFEKNNNIDFDIICKSRSDIIFRSDVKFICDKRDDLILRNKHMCDIRYWGHVYNDTPLMISDAFVYGNKKTMGYYCSTYNWILNTNQLLEGKYLMAGEIYVTDNILQYNFYKIPGGEVIPTLNREQIIDKYTNNPNNITIIYQNNISYYLLPPEIRQSTNFVVDMNNVYNYTHE